MAKIPFVGLDPVSEAVFKRHWEYSHGLGLPEVQENRIPLAVVGGGKSATHNVKNCKNLMERFGVSTRRFCGVGTMA